MPRQDIYKLARLVLAPSTLKTYDRYLGKFLRWLEKRELDEFEDLTELDHLLTMYCIYTHDKHKGNNRQRCIHVKNALEFYFPELAGTFRLTNRSLNGWAKQKPIVQHSPAPYKVMLGIAFEFLRDGQLGMMVATLLTFDCYLRASDIKNAKPMDLTLFPALRNGYCGVLRLPKTKRGINQSVKVRGKLLHIWLRRLLDERQQSKELFGFSLQYWRKCMARIRNRLGLHNLVITPHSLRYGGATYDALERKTSMQDIQQRGRWANFKSLRRYIQEGETTLLSTKLPLAASNQFEEIAANVGRYFNIPTSRKRVRRNRDN